MEVFIFRKGKGKKRTGEVGDADDVRAVADAHRLDVAAAAGVGAAAAAEAGRDLGRIERALVEAVGATVVVAVAVGDAAAADARSRLAEVGRALVEAVEVAVAVGIERAAVGARVARRAVVDARGTLAAEHRRVLDVRCVTLLQHALGRRAQRLHLGVAHGELLVERAQRVGDIERRRRRLLVVVLLGRRTLHAQRRVSRRRTDEFGVRRRRDVGASKRHDA